MGILSWIVFGFVVGLIARAVMPGRQNFNFVMTTLLGIGGSFLGGAIGSALAGVPMDQIHAAGMIGSVIGAVVLLFAAGAILGRGGRVARPV